MKINDSIHFIIINEKVNLAGIRSIKVDSLEGKIADDMFGFMVKVPMDNKTKHPILEGIVNSSESNLLFMDSIFNDFVLVTHS